ncbi:uncharacterized protein LOC117170773 [Belonocnema kinseyi]|uniref:uncharacterized protein LOC117170773 n=1 Tax=Belonocnema kinseyi TaxID=2817044 RepID=UPI00143D2317|nr:uncharacterized protein LOC117170773 [Belonocnema kinseyi]
MNRTYVTNQVSEIQTTLPSAIWHYVPAKDNPADCASRRVSALGFSSFSLYWNGPKWLPNSDDRPSSPFEPPDSSVDMEERVKVNLVVFKKNHWYLFHPYSSLGRLLRITALCFRFYNAMTHISKITSPYTTASELHQAHLSLIRHEQHRAFPEEIAVSKEKDDVSKRSRLLKFNPFGDGELLRVGGRLKHYLLSFNEKHPLLLPSDCILTKIVIEDCHRRCLHVAHNHENLPPTKWALGRVIKLHHGRDGLIRVVKLKTQRGTVTRPLLKFCLLPRATSDPKEVTSEIV